MDTKRSIAFLSHIDINLYLFRLPIMKALSEKGWEVYAVVPEGNYCRQLEEEGIKVVNYPIDRKSLNPFKEIRSILEIAKVLKRIKPYILHTFTAKPNIYGVLAGRLAKVPFIVNTITGLGSFFIEDSFKARLVRKMILSMYRLTLKRANFVVFQNRDDYNYFLKIGLVDKERATVIRGSGIDTDLWKPEKRSKNNGVVRVITVGRLLKHKGIHEFLEVAFELKKIYGNKVEFIVVGSPDEGNPYSIDTKYLDSFKEKGVIKHIEWLNPEELRKLMSNSDIFVLLSYREGLPRTGIEALSLGLPLVVSDTVGCREVVEDGQNGYLVDVRNTGLIANKLSTLIEDRALREKMGACSREIAVKEYDVKRVIEKYIEIYNRAVG